MRSTLTGLLGLITLVLVLPLRAGEQPGAGPGLWPENRRRELLHRQIREMLDSADSDVQQLGIVFHVLGKYDPQELVPLVSGKRRSAWMALQVLGAEPLSGEAVQAVLTRLGNDPGWGRNYGVTYLEEHAPRWRDRPELDRVVLQLLDRLPYGDEEDRDATSEMLTLLEFRLTPHIPRLLTLAEQESEPAEAGKILQIIPWQSLGDHRDETIRRVSALLLRHQSRSLDWDIWNAWRNWPGRLTEAELDPLLRDALRFRESDADPDYSIHETLVELAQTLDQSWPGWRQRSVVRQAIVQLRAEARHAEATRQQCGLEALIALGETKHPELRDYLLKHVLSPRPADWESGAWLMEAVEWSDLDLAPADRGRLLRHWLKLLDAPPSPPWRTTLNGLRWLGPEAKPAVPRLLSQMERMLWEEAETWQARPGNGFDNGPTYDPEDFGITLSEIDPHWKTSLAGRRIASLICDRIQWKLAHQQEDAGEAWERRLWEQFSWSTPGLQAEVLRLCLNPRQEAGEEGPPDLGEVMPHLDTYCPGWHESAAARVHWRRLEPDYPWPADPGRNRLFLRLTLHHPGLSREQQRDYLLQAVAAGLCLGPEFQAALDAVDPDWPQSPQARQAVPKLVERFQAELASEAGYPDLDCWRMLKRLGAAGPLEYPLLLRLWLQEEFDLDFFDADLQLPATEESLQQRLGELRPDYRQAPQTRRFRHQALLRLVSEDEDIRAHAFQKLCRMGLLTYRSQADLQLLPDLLAALARNKEAEEQWEATDDEGRVIPRPGPRASRQLWQLRLNLRQQKILDGPILLPDAPPAEKPNPSGITP